MKYLSVLLLLVACQTPAEGTGSGGAGSGPSEQPPTTGVGQGGGFYTYQPCNETCPGDCLLVPDGDKTIGACAAPCQTEMDCPTKENGHSICKDHKCGLSCGTGSCPDVGMKCVSGVCGFPLPAPVPQ